MYYLLLKVKGSSEEFSSLMYLMLPLVEMSKRMPSHQRPIGRMGCKRETLAPLRETILEFKHKDRPSIQPMYALTQ